MTTGTTERNPFADAPLRLLDGLVADGRLTTVQRNQALAQRDQKGGSLGEILIDMGVIQQDELAPLLVKHCRIPFVSLLDYLVDGQLLEFVPEDVCKRLQVLPVDKMGRHLTLAMVHPLDQQALADVQHLNPTLTVRPILCEAAHFDEVCHRLFGSGEAAMNETLFDRLAPKSPPKKDPPEKTSETPPAAPAKPVAKLISPPPPGADDPTAEMESAPSDILGSSSLDLADAMGEMMSMAQQSMDGTYEVLARRIELFRGLEPRAVSRIFALGVTKEVLSGEVIFQKGAPGDSLYVIVSGCVRILDNDKEIAILSTGDTFGEMSVITGEPRSATAIAAQTTSLLILTEAQFQKLMTKQVSIRLLLNMLGTMSARLRKSNDILRSLMR